MGRRLLWRWSRGSRKEKAKGQLGNFLKGAENSSECVSHSLGGSRFQGLGGCGPSLGAKGHGCPVLPRGRSLGPSLETSAPRGTPPHGAQGRGGIMPEGYFQPRLHPSYSQKGSKAGCGDTRGAKAT